MKETEVMSVESNASTRPEQRFRVAVEAKYIVGIEFYDLQAASAEEAEKIVKEIAKKWVKMSPLEQWESTHPDDEPRPDFEASFDCHCVSANTFHVAPDKSIAARQD